MLNIFQDEEEGDVPMPVPQPRTITCTLTVTIIQADDHASVKIAAPPNTSTYWDEPFCLEFDGYHTEDCIMDLISERLYTA